MKPWYQPQRAATGLAGIKKDGVVATASASQGVKLALRQSRKTGCLNLASKELRAVPREVIAPSEHLEEDEKFWEVAELSKVDLSHNELEELPEELGTIGPSLRALLLKQNALSQLTPSLFDLVGLAVLDLTGNRLCVLSEAVGQLSALRELLLANNRLQALPESLGALSQLETLQVDGNALRALPRSIGQLRALSTFTAPDNQLQELPTSLLSLPRLRLLDARRNALAGDLDLGSLTSLTFADFRENHLKALPRPPRPSVLSQLYVGLNAITRLDGARLAAYGAALTELDVQGNGLTLLPTEAGSLVGLKALDVSNNDLREVPPALGYLAQLNRLALDGNPIRTIRRSLLSGPISELKAYLRTRGPPAEGMDARLAEGDVDEGDGGDCGDLTGRLREAASSGVLSLAGLDLTAFDRDPEQLPPWVSRTSSLELTGCRPASASANFNSRALLEMLEALTSLSTLEASDIGMECLPAPLLGLPLSRLVLSRNRLGRRNAFPPPSPALQGTALFRSLGELDLRHCGLSELPPCLLLLRGLHTLLLGHNSLASIAVTPQSWASMKALNMLDVSNNRLRELGDVYTAPALASLDLTNNELQALPPELGLCESLRALLLAGNPQRANTISKGTAAVLQYLRDRLPAGFSLPVGPDFADETTPLPQAGGDGHGYIAPPSKGHGGAAAPQHPKQSSGGSTMAARGVDEGKQGQQVVRYSPAKPDPMLDAEIERLEQALDDVALTTAKRMALRRELGRKRALRLQQQQQQQQQRGR